MNEFEYECKLRKQLANGSRHMKRGSRSKKCSLLSDLLTPAQIKKRNGKVITMNINEPMTWEEFKACPLDIQKEYVAKCVERFECSRNDFTAIFNVSSPTIQRYFMANDITSDHFKPGNRMPKEKRAEFLAWLGNEEPMQEVSPEQKEQSVAEIAPIEEMNNNVPWDYRPTHSIKKLTCDFIGFPTFQELNRLWELIPDPSNVRVSLVIEEGV